MSKKPINSFQGVKTFSKVFHESTMGYFAETYKDAWLEETFLQDSVSLSKKAGTIRGLHFQKDNSAQGKLITVLEGSIQDYFVDLRINSPSFKDYGSIKISKLNNLALFIPRGFAHGFITLEPDTIVSYKLDNYYSPKNEVTISWDDPDLAINWPKNFTYSFSSKDLEGIKLKDFLKMKNQLQNE